VRGAVGQTDEADDLSIAARVGLARIHALVSLPESRAGSLPRSVVQARGTFPIRTCQSNRADSLSFLRALLCGVLGVCAVTSVLAAQELRDTIGPLEQKANPITPRNPIPRRTQSVAPSYPPEGRALGAMATVVLAVTIEEWGCVAEIRRGPEPMLTTAAMPAPTTCLKVRRTRSYAK